MLPAEIPLLDGSNYHCWERAMKAFLQTKELYKYLRDTYVEQLLLTEAELIQYNLDATPEGNDYFITKESWPSCGMGGQ